MAGKSARTLRIESELQRVLSDLIRREVRGRTHVCRLDPAPLASARAWLEQCEAFWTGRLDALELLLRAEDAGQSPNSDGETR